MSCSNSIRCATFDAIAAAGSGGGPALLQTPQNANVAGYDQPLAKSYNGNVAFQRDIGFNTTAEIAWVGNYQYEGGRTVDVNRLPLYVYGNPANLVNNAPLNNNSLRPVYGTYPGMGSVTQFVKNLYPNTLKYNALQLNVQRRLSKGFQIGGAYTLAKGEGYTGYDPYTDEIGGKDAIRVALLGSDGRRPPAPRVGQLQLQRADASARAGHQVHRERLAGLGRHDAPERRGHHAELHARTSPASRTATRR